MSEVKARANALLQESFGPSAERIRNTLRDLGFSGYAAEAFCALVQMSHATAGDLVLKTGIPDSKIYYALDELAEKGLVEVQNGKPRTYRVVPAKEVEIRLSRLVEAEYEKRRAATTRLGSLLEPRRAAADSCPACGAGDLGHERPREGRGDPCDRVRVRPRGRGWPTGPDDVSDGGP